MEYNHRRIPMKIALVGYGKMGKSIEQAAINCGHSITAIIDPKAPVYKEITEEALADADVCIDFSRPDCALENIRKAAAFKKNIVVGTTGWYDRLDEAKQLVETANTGLLYAPNFSIGITLFLKIIAEAAQLIAPWNLYDAAGMEIHHRQKADSPSGTAKKIAEVLDAYIPQKDKSHTFTSIRVGGTVGTHSLIFDSPFDTITLTHTARNRDGYVNGALHAAEWLIGKQGFFTFPPSDNYHA